MSKMLSKITQKHTLGNLLVAIGGAVSIYLFIGLSCLHCEGYVNLDGELAGNTPWYKAVKIGSSNNFIRTDNLIAGIVTFATVILSMSYFQIKIGSSNALIAGIITSITVFLLLTYL